MKRLILLLFILFIFLLPSVTLGATEIIWYGHASFKIQTPKGNVLLIDPWFTNPVNKEGEKQLEELKKVDLILITHTHRDHIGDSIEIAKKQEQNLSQLLI